MGVPASTRLTMTVVTMVAVGALMGSGAPDAEPDRSPEAAAPDVFRPTERSRLVATVEPAVMPGDDVATIPVTDCASATDLDSLPPGTACHYTPVSVGEFVVGHDYLGNGWWNTIPVGAFVELDGTFAGLYEVTDRVMAPGRGTALGPAADWTCGDHCDVILQTCRGDNTGFTWLRKVSSEE